MDPTRRTLASAKLSGASAMAAEMRFTPSAAATASAESALEHSASRHVAAICAVVRPPSPCRRDPASSVRILSGPPSVARAFRASSSEVTSVARALRGEEEGAERQAGVE